MSKIFDALRKAEQERKGRAGIVAGSASRQVTVFSGKKPDVTGIELSALRNSVELALPNKSSRCLLVTTSLAGEGATSVTHDLCQVLAQDPMLRILGVDGDFSRSDLTRRFKVEPGPGLTEILRGEATLETGIVKTPVQNLDFLRGGVNLPGVSQLISSAQMKSVLRELSSLYHFVVVDSGPALSSPETIVLGSHTDGVILVVRASKTRREIVQKAVNMLSQSHANVIGVVFNRRKFAIPAFIYKRL
ncbi:MAG: CpsD/CapB family tyrosine-protein kinase [Candidatus Eisenbacteria bacterium]|nr:CpsD/CapB family tyrosine-protein kinase [Candidatus Eisenbacteria bacterium]